jgi:hypothetical protein
MLICIAVNLTEIFTAYATLNANWPYAYCGHLTDLCIIYVVTFEDFTAVTMKNVLF